MKPMQPYPISSQIPYLVAVSGGVDSMVLLHWLVQNKYTITVAHCNFMLRGQESMDDEAFVKNYCKEHKITCYTQCFETEKIARINKTSIQIQARQLRYHWFAELLQKLNIPVLLTAHHLNDSVETFIINLTRGTGLKGLVGIPNNITIQRPLLQTTRNQIEIYAQQQQVPFRNDSSNASDKYLRNQIRHHVVPQLEKLTPTFYQSFLQTLTHLQQSDGFVQEVSTQILAQIVTALPHNTQALSIAQLLAYTHYTTILYQWLQPYGFTAWDDIYNLPHALTGKYVQSPTHKVLKNRQQLLLAPIQPLETEVYYIHNATQTLQIPVRLQCETVAEMDEQNPNVVYLNKDALTFPLEVKQYTETDYFYPTGMKGKKKIGKFFRDSKISRIAIENTWIIYSQNQIVWIIGHRADQRFAATTTTANILKITLYV